MRALRRSPWDHITVKLVKLLLDAGLHANRFCDDDKVSGWNTASDGPPMTLLALAVRCEDTDMVSMLLEHDADFCPNAANTVIGDENTSAVLHVAVVTGRSSLITLLLNQGLSPIFKHEGRRFRFVPIPGFFTPLKDMLLKHRLIARQQKPSSCFYGVENEFKLSLSENWEDTMGMAAEFALVDIK
ncbi:hypothetical protein BDV19DRAFT_21029 [Aspergillus venezuelensis]